MHGKKRVWVAVMPALLLVASCGGEDALQGSCGTQTTPDSDVICTDGRATSTVALTALHQGTCPSAQWSSSFCPRGDRLGGCLTPFGRTPEGGAAQLIFWYYPSPMVQSEADVMSRCINGEMFVPPDGGFPPSS
jgi:hypothetical protein